MKKSLIVVLALCLVLASLLGCAAPAPAPAPEAPAAAPADAAAPAAAPAGTLQSMINPDDTYYVVGCIDSIEYWNAHKYGWKKAGELYNVKTEWEAINGDDTTEMVTLFDNVVAKDPAGIVVLGWDEGLAPSIDAAEAAGIPVVTYSSDVVTSKREAWVGSDNYTLGYIGGKKYAESVGTDGTVAILTYPGKNNFDARQEGFEAAFKELGMTVVAVGNTQTDEAIAVQAAKDILAANPDLGGFVCCDATGAMGAATAIEEAGMTGKVNVVGLDRDSAMLERIKAGTITGSVVQEDATMLFWAMTVLIDANYYAPKAMLTSDNAAAGAKVTPEKIACAINFIDQNNVDYYLAANQAYIDELNK